MCNKINNRIKLLYQKLLTIKGKWRNKGTQKTYGSQETNSKMAGKFYLISNYSKRSKHSSKKAEIGRMDEKCRCYQKTPTLEQHKKNVYNF